MRSWQNRPPNTDAASIVGNIQDHVAPGATIYSDEHPAYRALPKVGYEHRSVAHSRDEYARGAVNVNAVENTWSQDKRTILGVPYHVSVKHLQRYLDEMCYRLNEGNVKIHVKERIAALCRLSAGARLTWKELIN